MAKENLTAVADYRGDFISLDHKGMPDVSNTDKENAKAQILNNSSL